MPINKKKDVSDRQRFLNSRFRVMGILFLAAFVFRLILMQVFRQSVSFDEAHYLRLGACFYEKGLAGLLHAYWPPLYPGLIALYGRILGNWELAGRLINVLSGSLLALVIYQMSRRLFGNREAFVAGLFAVLYPPLAYGATNVMPETLYTLTGICGLYMGWKAMDENEPVAGFFAGLLWGASYLLRPEGVGFLLVFMGFVFLLLLLSVIKRKWEGKLFFVIVLTVIGFLVLAMPYLVYLRNATGSWTLSAKGKVNQQLEAAVEFDTGEVKDPFMRLTEDNRFLPYDMAVHFGDMKTLTQDPNASRRIVSISIGHFLTKYTKNLYRIVKVTVPGTVTLVLFVPWILGFFGDVYDRRRLRLVLYASANIAFFWFILIPMFHVNERYLMPLLPLGFLWIGKGCVLLYGWIVGLIEKNASHDGRFYRIRGLAGWGMLLAFILIFSFLPEFGKVLKRGKVGRDMWAEPVELKEAGLWLKANTDQPPVLMSLNKAVDFYAGQYDMRRGASFSYDSLNRNLAYARHRNVEFLVFSDRYLEWYSNLQPLIDKDVPLDELELVYEQVDPAGIRTVIYRLLPMEGIPSEGK